MQRKTAIIIGDSFNNTLGLIRSVGQAGIKPILILIGKDRLFVSKSRYVGKTYYLNDISETLPLLRELSTKFRNAFIICSNDNAAKFIDDNENALSGIYQTPMRGKRINSLFNKMNQCRLAKECGVTVPKSYEFKRGENISTQFRFPILLKPNNSVYGSKSDIHVCNSIEEFNEALDKKSDCNTFIIQEFIDKEYEINLIGVVSDKNVIIPGGVRKIRHYPNPQSPCSFGLFLPIDQLPVDINPIIKFVKSTEYNGPFSIELLHSNNRNYFMEINFRHDGLAYVATAAGINLLDYFINQPTQYKRDVKPTYLLDLSIDYCHVKDKNIRKTRWWKDFFKAGCQLNFNIKDPLPTFYYYLEKFKKH